MSNSATIPAPATKAPEAPTAEKPKKATTGEEVFPTAEEAIKVATSRDKGARQAFKLEIGGKTTFMVSHNHHHASGVMFRKLGGKCERIDVAERAPKPVGIDGIMAAVNGLPEAERAAVLEQIRALAAKK